MGSTEPSLATWAEIWRVRLERRLATAGQVRAWADDRIAQLDTSPEWLIELSLARSEAEALSAVALGGGEVDERFVWVALMTSFRDLLSQDPGADDRVAKQLFRLAAYEGGGPTPEAEQDMLAFWDGLDLARQGILSDLAAQQARLREFLEHWSRLESYPGHACTEDRKLTPTRRAAYSLAALVALSLGAVSVVSPPDFIGLRAALFLLGIGGLGIGYHAVVGRKSEMLETLLSSSRSPTV